MDTEAVVKAVAARVATAVRLCQLELDQDWSAGFRVRGGDAAAIERRVETALLAGGVCEAFCVVTSAGREPTTIQVLCRITHVSERADGARTSRKADRARPLNDYLHKSDAFVS